MKVIYAVKFNMIEGKHIESYARSEDLSVRINQSFNQSIDCTNSPKSKQRNRINPK